MKAEVFCRRKTLFQELHDGRMPGQKAVDGRMSGNTLTCSREPRDDPVLIPNADAVEISETGYHENHEKNKDAYSSCPLLDRCQLAEEVPQGKPTPVFLRVL
jgi:hypothetical protein